MAKDDFHVIAYKILSYLYQQIKNGEQIEPGQISARKLMIEPVYWEYIMNVLRTNGLAEGYEVIRNTNGERSVMKLHRAEITMKGIEYLASDEMIRMVKAEEDGILNI